MTERLKKKIRTETDVFWFDELDSTQNEVRRRLSDRSCGKLIVGADCQTDGRGRRGRTFFSPAGTGLYFTVAFPCEGAAVMITCAAACVVCEALERLAGVHPGIKWVNDIELDGKKIAGILTERIGGYIVIGVGINLTTTAFPPEIRDRAGRVGKTVDNTALCAMIADGLFDLPKKAEGMIGEYRRRSVLIGKEILFEQNGVMNRGTVEGFDDAGGMIVQTDSGTLTLTSGEVTVRMK